MEPRYFSGQFVASDFRDQDFRGDILSGKFFDCEFEGADLTGAHLIGEFTNCTFAGAIIDDTTILSDSARECIDASGFVL